MADSYHPLRKLTDEWNKKIKAAKKHKAENFGCYADAAEKLFCGPVNWMWDSIKKKRTTGATLQSSDSMPNFQISINRLFEAVALYGPSMMGQNPDVQVNPRVPPMPPATMFGNIQDPNVAMIYEQVMAQISAYEEDVKVTSAMMEYYINSIQEDGGKVINSQRAITESIVSGMGGVYTELYTPPGSTFTFPKSRFKSQSDVVWDPDAKHFEDITWMAVRWEEPINRFSQKFNISLEEIEKNFKKSSKRQSTAGAASTRNDAANFDSGYSCDLIEYWEVFSKNGMGQWLHAFDRDKTSNHELQQVLESLGQYCRIVVCEGVQYPINLPHEFLQYATDEQVMERVGWPIPFFMDESQFGGWPWTPLYYYEQIGCSYPMSIARPVLPLIEFVNYLVSCLADRTKSCCETMVGILKEAAEDIDQQLKNQKGPYKKILLQSDMGRKIEDLISYIQSPQAVPDVWVMLKEAVDMIDKGTGLTDIIYGMSKSSFRSATEAEVKNQNSTIRPEDMSNKFERWLGCVAQKEMFAAFYLASPEDFAEVLGPIGGQYFVEKMLSLPLDKFARGFNFTIAAGSTRRMNQASKQVSLERFAQVAMPMFQEQLAMGNTNPVATLLGEYAETLQMDPKPYRNLASPPPATINPQDQKLQEEQQKHVQKLLFEEEDHEQEMRHAEELFTVEVEGKKRLQAAQPKRKPADKRN